MTDDLPVPSMFSAPIAARLLGFRHSVVFSAHVAENPALFLNSTLRRFALVDIEANPRRAGRPVTAAEFLTHECTLAGDRAKWRALHARRAATDRGTVDLIHRVDRQAAAR